VKAGGRSFVADDGEGKIWAFSWQRGRWLFDFMKSLVAVGGARESIDSTISSLNPETPPAQTNIDSNQNIVPFPILSAFP
jgi:hypothetical protein